MVQRLFGWGGMMHFVFLVEDMSGERFLETIIPKFDAIESHEIHSYKGIGRLPAKGSGTAITKQHGLLGNLSKLLQGFGKSYRGTVACAIVVCDSDSKTRTDFLAELNAFLQTLSNPIRTHFAVATEEMEAWFLGDQNAIRAAYPKARLNELRTYTQDSICGTWELLARVLGHKPEKMDWKDAGKLKFEWAEQITPHMDVQNNSSNSFNEFRELFSR